MTFGKFTEQEIEELEKAKRTRKYGHISTWKGLVFFQMIYSSIQQCKEIGEWAEKANRGERVILPLMNNTK